MNTPTTTILEGVSWNFGELYNDGKSSHFFQEIDDDENGTNEVTSSQFKSILEKKEITLTPYENHQVVFLYPSIVGHNFTSYQPVYYDVYKFNTAFDIVKTIDDFYQDDYISIDPKLKKAILDNTNFKEGMVENLDWKDSHANIQLLGGPNELNIVHWRGLFSKLSMILPGVYKVSLEYS